MAKTKQEKAIDIFTDLPLEEKISFYQAVGALLKQSIETEVQNLSDKAESLDNFKASIQ